MARKRTLEDVIDLTSTTPDRCSRASSHAEVVKHVRIDKVAVAESTFHKLMQAAQKLPTSTSKETKTMAASRPLPEPRCKYCGERSVSLNDPWVRSFTDCSACGGSVCNICSNFLREVPLNSGDASKLNWGLVEQWQ
ncbi:hypothetical protein Pmar_PMAR003150 [Perkinsus marinus ATCC 50983]|uniref:Uncharacterized protein n=1 Tax=Perkinsus marinus (strain ATCC 50983 / TXsc) TaxID=423536 RepID=C5L315_PERM5|nr:hypothetical protein Pmar_PMAR003150 [Perkinsus marinus ATCC 50983]EER08902.1 hypothetical protein Pmar_PMAR003150 [Perkinsus marinus ATCC 50983]|eukprot:XP_002777086.1 hypothetical protein Pmar_PMAR003150 [Perkinsus marinus ATCC 50983]